MHEDQHERVSELFAAVYELDPPQQAAYLDDACGDDADLRAQVEELLRHHDQSSPFMDAPLLGSRFPLHGAETAPQPDAGLAGRHVGHYSLKRVIASGGMGTVYEAVQEKPHRTVAVKLMKRGIASRSALRRFEYESQILARLRHPGIAQVYEADTQRLDGDSVPYFVMEYIPGAHMVTEYASLKKLDVRQRLELFATACDAVHHGHQKGIIHRDLKPANILVDSSGRVKIIDFGVARATDSDLATTTLQTDAGQLIGTLQYMSPEQCEGDPHDLDTRSDVYALGVVLYELLCEQLPYDVTRATVPEAVQMIREQSPHRPSTVLRMLHGDVETILLKALEKDRDRRYESAAELAGDLRRYLHSEPITAHPPSAMYKLRKFAGRHRGLATAAAAVVLVLVTGVITTTAQAVRARTEATRAQAVINLIDEMLGSANPDTKKGPGYTVKALLTDFERELGDRLADQPLVEATLRATIGKAYLFLGETDQAQPHLLVAREIRHRELGVDHERAVASDINWAGLLHDRGQYGEAERLLRDALVRAKGLSSSSDALQLSIQSGLGDALRHQGRYAEAEQIFVQTLEIHRRVLGDEHLDTADSMGNLALIYMATGRPNEAEPLLLETLDIQKRVLGPEHLRTLGSMTNLGNLYMALDRFDDAEELYRSSVGAKRRVLGLDHPWTRIAMRGLATVYERTDRRDLALPLRRELLEFLVSAAEMPDASARALNEAAWTLLTIEHEPLRDPERSMGLATRAVDLTNREDPTILDTLALALFETGDAAAAIETERRALELLPADAPGREGYVSALRRFEAAVAEGDGGGR